MDDQIVINTISPLVPNESFVPNDAPIVIDVIKDLDSETLALTIDLAGQQAHFEQVIDFLQRRCR